MNPQNHTIQDYHHSSSTSNHTFNSPPNNPRTPSIIGQQPFTPNHAWGDSMLPLPHTKKSTTLRISFQNARGIRTYNTWSEWIHTCQHINKYNIRIFGTVETNINWTPEHKQTMHQLALKHLTTPRTVAASSQHTPTRTDFQPGGTLLLSSGRWTCRCHQARIDPSGMGRWTHLVLEGKHNITINIP